MNARPIRFAWVALALLGCLLAIWREPAESLAQGVPISGLPTLTPFPSASDVVPVVHYPSGTTSGTTSKATLPQLLFLYNVLWYGADPTDTNDSTSAFQTAVNLASQTGGTVLVPQGTYLLGGPINLPGGSAGGAYAIRGAGSGASILDAQRPDYDVFYGCAAAAPSGGNPTLFTPTPYPMPSPTNFSACAAPASSDQLSGFSIQDLGILHRAGSSYPSYGSDINLPSVLRASVERLQTSGSYTVVALGEDAPNQWGSVTIDQNNFLNFSNAMLVLHGGGGQLFVNSNYALGTPPPSTSNAFGPTVLDASDSYSTTAQFIANNDFESIENGMIYIVNASGSGTGFFVGDSFFDSNLFNNVGAVGFLAWAYPNQTTKKPFTQRLKIRNSTFNSAWDGVYFDGGGYAVSGSTGVTDASVHGTTVSAGASGKTSQLILFSGAPQSGNTITFSYTPPGMSAVSVMVTAPAAEPLSTLVNALASAINSTSSTNAYLQAGSITLANAFYGMLFVSTKTAPTTGQITNGSVSLSTTGSGTYPIAVVMPGSGTYSSNMMAGNGIYLVNNPHSIDIMANDIYGSLGAGIYISSTAHMNAFADSLSNNLGTGNTYGIYFDPGATFSDVFVQTNDITNNSAGAVAGATPSPAATAALFRNNRGFSPVGYLTPTFPGSPATVYATYDCYVTISGLPSMATVTLTGSVSSSSYSPIIVSGVTSFPVYAGTKLTVTYTGTPTWSWFCN